MKIFRRKNTWNKIEVKPFSRKCNSFTISLLSKYFSKPLIHNNFKIELVTENNIYELLFGRRLYLKKDDKTIDRSKATYRDANRYRSIYFLEHIFYKYSKKINKVSIFKFSIVL